MCGKFTAMASWAQVVAFSDTFSTAVSEAEVANDRELAYRVMGNLPIIIWNKQSQHCYVLSMRWGFPHRSDWRRPQPIHARSDTIETTKAFAAAFLDGQRGIALVKTFNEAPDIEGPSIQHTIQPGQAKALGVAFVWRQFQIPGVPTPLLACCMVTVPANNLIASLPTDRMPAVLDPEEWSKWLGQELASVDELKSCLKTVEGFDWKMAKERKSDRKTKRGKPTLSDPGGLF